MKFAEIYGGTRGDRFEISRERLQELEAEERLNLLLEELQKKGQKLTPSELRQIFSVYRSNTIADTAYLPQPSHLPITLFRAQEMGHLDFLPDAVATQQDPTWGWHRLSTQPIRLHLVPGNHFTMVKEPHVQSPMEKLKISLNFHPDG